MSLVFMLIVFLGLVMKKVGSVRFQLHTTHIDQVTTQLGLVPRQCSLTFCIL
jgi:hypothetical protein